MRGFTALSLALLFAAAAGCRFAAPTRPYAADKAIDPEAGYLYGRFSLAGKGSSRLLLVIENLDLGRAYYVRFEADRGRELLAIAVPPGDYRISHVLFTLPGAAVHWQGYRNIPIGRPPIQAPFPVEPGRCTYLGDYRGAIKTDFGKGGYEYAGALEEIAYAFEKTTVAFGMRYPTLRSCPRNSAWRPDPPRP